MRSPAFRFWLISLVFLAEACVPKGAPAAVPNSLMLNEANTVSGGNFLDKGRGDTTFGRVEGNGQNWLEFLVAQGDQTAGGFKHTLDLRGWTINWSYDKDNLHQQYGAGTIQFSQDAQWAAVPMGSLLTVSEWQDAWYNVNTPAGYDPVPGAGGLQRDGGINGLGHLRGSAFKSDGSDIHLGATNPANDPHLLATDTSWNPAANGGGANGDWSIHVFAGERNPDTSFKYFNFTGSVTDSTGTYAIGTDDGGLFVANNDEWQYTIKDAQGNVIQGPIGEHLPGSNFGVNPNEIERLEAFSDRLSQPTQAQYLGATIADYESGSSSTYGTPNVWNSGDDHQGLAALRNWLQPGDADLDGTVTAADYVVWRSHAGTAGDWRSGDFNGDGMVDQSDYTIWRAHFGQSAGSGAGLGSAAVPEPTVCALLAISAVLLSVQRRFSR